MKRQTYEEWGFEVINLICAEEQMHTKTKVEEIKGVIGKDEFYYGEYEMGNRPDEAWEDSKDAMIASQ